MEREMTMTTALTKLQYLNMPVANPLWTGGNAGDGDSDGDEVLGGGIGGGVIDAG